MKKQLYPCTKLSQVQCSQDVDWFFFWHFLFKNFFLQDISHISPFSGTTDTSFLDIWWHLFWVQSQSGQPYLHLVETYVLHVPWDSTLVWHLLTSWQPIWQLSRSLPHTCELALVRFETGTYGAADKCSTDWAMPAQLSFWHFHVAILISFTRTFT